MLVTTLVLLLLVRLVYRRQAGRCTSPNKLHGKTAIVTGASAGIGSEAAKDFAERGARVILACRNVQKGQKVADDIIQSSGNTNVEVRMLDIADLSSVRHFAQQILQTEKFIHILVNNAGIQGPQERLETKDGLELTMATNHFGHFLLTNLLLKRLRNSAPSRIINVSSAAHLTTTNVTPTDLNFRDSKYGPMAAYSQSKLCNILFTLALADKLRGTGVTVNSLHPGAVATEFFVKEDATKNLAMKAAAQILGAMVIIAGKDSKLGAQTVIHLAVSEEGERVSGKYFEDCEEGFCSRLGKDQALAKAVWEASEDEVQLRPAEIQYY